MFVDCLFSCRSWLFNSSHRSYRYTIVVFNIIFTTFSVVSLVCFSVKRICVVLRVWKRADVRVKEYGIELVWERTRTSSFFPLKRPFQLLDYTYSKGRTLLHVHSVIEFSPAKRQTHAQSIKCTVVLVSEY